MKLQKVKPHPEREGLYKSPHREETAFGSESKKKIEWSDVKAVKRVLRSAW